MQPSRYFTEDEMKCKCCGLLPNTPTFNHMVELLDRARWNAGIPFTVLSGYRCPKHDVEEKGEGNHPIAAVDIKVASGDEAFRVVRGLMEAGFKRIGISRKKLLVHADIVPGRPTPALWTYGE